MLLIAEKECVMLFDVNQVVFTNEYQKKVWQSAIQIIPPEISFRDIADNKTVEGCTQIYNCITQILTAMYDAPDTYADISVNEYICACFDWFRFRCGNGYSEKDGTVWSVYGEIRKEKLDFYISVFDRLSEFGFRLSRGEYVTSERKGYINISGEKPFVLLNDMYPLFLKYWAVFREAFMKKKKFGPQLQLLDFRLLAPRYKCTADDLLRPLPDKYKRYFKELYEYALSKGAKQESAPNSNYLRFSYKKLYILVLGNNPPIIEVPYRLSNGGHIPDEFERFLEQAQVQTDNDALVTYIQKNIAICNGCRIRREGIKQVNERCGKWVQIRDKRRYVNMCHCAVSKHHHGERFRVYDENDTVMLKRMIDIRIAQIDDYLGGK